MKDINIVEHYESVGTNYIISHTNSKLSVESLHEFNPMGSSYRRSPGIFWSIGAIESGKAMVNSAVDESLSFH